MKWIKTEENSSSEVEILTIQVQVFFVKLVTWIKTEENSSSKVEILTIEEQVFFVLQVRAGYVFGVMCSLILTGDSPKPYLVERLWLTKMSWNNFEEKNKTYI